MLTLSQAIRRRGSSGEPLPDIYTTLARRGARVPRAGLTLIVGPASAGKSLLMFNLLAGYARHNLSGLAFLLDTNELDAAARFAAILTGDSFSEVKSRVIGGDGSYEEKFRSALPLLHTVFYAPTFEDVGRQMDAFSQRYGLPPDVMVLDNLGNQTSGMENEWAVLKAMALELDNLAKVEQCAVIAAHHTTDLVDMEPAARDKVLGKISQYAALMLSVNFNPETQEYKVAVVKTREGASDLRAGNPVVMWADPSRMAITENEQVARSWRQAPPLEAAPLRSMWDENPDMRPHITVPAASFGGLRG